MTNEKIDRTVIEDNANKILLYMNDVLKIDINYQYKSILKAYSTLRKQLKK